MRHLILAGLLLLGSAGASAQERAVDRRVAAQRAAEDTIRELVPGPAAFRGVAAFRQGVPRAVAVCGAVRVGPATAAFMPFVAVVTYRDEESEGGTVTPILPTAEEGAARVTAETASRCREGGGAPSSGTTTAREAEGPRPPDERPAAPARGGARPGDTVVARLPGSLRSSPDGRGSFLGVVRAGTSVTIHRAAPGGWYEVGDAAGPTGWVHGSRLFGTP